MVHRSILTVAVLCAALIGFVPAHGQGSPTRAPSLAVAPQPLAEALETFALQTGLHLIYPAKLAAGLRSPGAPANLPPRETLRQLLRGTGLKAQWLDERTVSLEAEGPNPSLVEGKEGKTPSSKEFRMAQVDRGAPAGVATVTEPSQRQQEESTTLQEVIVTAQKYQQREVDVPMSLQVLGSQELNRRGITSLSDLQFSVPGMYVQNTGLQRRIELDGVSNVFGSGALVGQYVDDAGATATPNIQSYAPLDLRAYDLQRVEVLKGPQGTLYGEGSMGGTIRYITNEPVLSHFYMNLDAQAEFVQYGAPGQRIVAMLNTPIITDTLGLRFAGELEHGGGWIDQPTANLKNINDTNLVDVRTEGLWRPVSQLTISALQIIHRNAFGPNQGEDESGNYTQPFGFTYTPNAQDNYHLSNMTVTYDFPRIRLLSSTTYFRHSVDSWNFNGITQYTPPGTPPYLDFFFHYGNYYRDFSQELRLAHVGGGPWQWTLGGYYKDVTDATTPESYYYTLQGLPPGTLYHAGSTDLGSKAWAAFGDTSYKFFDQLAVGAGIRYFRDKENAVTSAGRPAQSGVFASTDPRIYVLYELAANINGYASAAKGFRSGGFNANGQPPYQPDTVWRYEIGTKMRFPSARLKADADVFLADYTNYVVVGYDVENPADIYHNGGDVRIKGVEGDVSWIPLPDWIVSITADYIDGRFVSVNVLGADYRVGDPVDMVPRYSAAVSAERDFFISSKPAYVRFDYSQRPPESYRLRSIGPWYYGESSHLYLLGIRAGVAWNESLTLALFAQNLLNGRGYIDPFQIGGNGAREQPRTVGIEFQVK